MARLRDPIPAKRTLLRPVPRDREGPIFFVDIDKTYLLTKFESRLALARIPFEGAEDKVPNPGMPALLSGLSGKAIPLFFISASPPQLAKVLRERMQLDGVQPSGMTLKDQLRLLLRGRPRKLFKHVGFKLKALLAYRRELPPQAPWYLVGDDAESDALVYGMFSDLCAGRWKDGARRRVLERVGLDEREADAIEGLLDQLPGGDPVRNIFILRTRQHARGDLVRYGPRVLDARNPLLLSFLLVAREVLPLEVAVRVGRELCAARGEGELVAALVDGCRRKLLPRALVDELLGKFREAGLWPEVLSLTWPEDDGPAESDTPWCLPSSWD